MRHARLLSTGSYVPERVVTNVEVDALIGEPTSEWLIANVGIRERRWMAADQNTSDLVVEAATPPLTARALRRKTSTCSSSLPIRPIIFPRPRPSSYNTNSA